VLPKLCPVVVRGNNKGTIVPSREIDMRTTELHTPCVELPTLSTPYILEVNTTDFNSLCDQIPEITIVLGASNIENIVSFDLSESIEFNAENKTCDLIVEPVLDHIQLVKNNEVLAKIFHANSLFSVMIDPSISLSHARDKIAELKCLSTFKSIYAPSFQFNLIGDYGIDNIFFSASNMYHM
jgi:hypothetical protein